SADWEVVVVQPNIPQRERWDPERQRRNLHRHLALSEAPADARRRRIVVWPEAAVAADLTAPRTAGLRAIIADRLPPGGIAAVGALRPVEDGAWNSIVAIADTGAVLGVYDKVHLVPFGEYMPLRDVLPLDAIAAGDRDILAGDQRAPLVA